MFRLLKYLPVIIPVVQKFLQSPQGKRAVAKAKAKLQQSRSGRRS